MTDYQCDICNKYNADSEEALEKHKKDEHGIEDSSPSFGKRLRKNVSEAGRRLTSQDHWKEAGTWALGVILSKPFVDAAKKILRR